MQLDAMQAISSSLARLVWQKLSCFTGLREYGNRRGWLLEILKMVLSTMNSGIGGGTLRVTVVRHV
jgi:hypothetical protein